MADHRSGTGGRWRGSPSPPASRARTRPRSSRRRAEASRAEAAGDPAPEQGRQGDGHHTAPRPERRRGRGRAQERVEPDAGQRPDPGRTSRTRKGKTVYKNDTAGLDFALNHVRADQPGETFDWVNDQVTGAGQEGEGDGRASPRARHPPAACRELARCSPPRARARLLGRQGERHGHEQVEGRPGPADPVRRGQAGRPDRGGRAAGQIKNAEGRTRSRPTTSSTSSATRWART